MCFGNLAESTTPLQLITANFKEKNSGNSSTFIQVVVKVAALLD